jgi:NAD(P)-dependent dehydrogenase (short-subunit alcohol dehydrogenase family)
MRLEGKTVIVTGAARGMGRAMVDAFLAEGAKIIAADLPSPLLDELGELESVTAVAGDLTDPAAIERVVAAGEGKIDVLNNVAGLLDGLRPIDEVSPEEWARVIAVNLTAPFLLCKAVIPVMVAQGGGVITNVASIGGIRAGRAGAAYTAAKHGAVGLSQNIAISHWPDNIRCNVMCPGATMTSMTEGQTLSERGMALFKAPRFRIAEAHQQASVAVFLATDEASNINGAILPVDYGQTAV